MTGVHSLLPVLRLTGSEPLTILPLTLETEAAAQAHYKACDRLKLERKQRRMCRRDPGVAETLVEAVSMSALECQYQFRFERWNCTLEGRYRASLLKRGKFCLLPSAITTRITLSWLHRWRHTISFDRKPQAQGKPSLPLLPLGTGDLENLFTALKTGDLWE